MHDDHVAGYVLLERLGEGAASTVHRAYPAGNPGRVVAVKRLRAAADPAGLEQLRREAAVLAHLAHPAVLPLVDVVADGDGLAVVVPYAPGGSLSHRLSAGPLPWPEVADLGARLAGALAAAHDAGVLHRDVKPANVLFGAEGEPRLADFGVALLRGEDGPTVGTAGYLAPEVAAGSPPSPGSDVYALGVLLYEALTGTPPFTGDTVEDVLAAAGRGVFPPVREQVDVPADVAATIERALAHDPHQRHPNAQALRGALEVALASHRPAAAERPDGGERTDEPPSAAVGRTRDFGPRPAPPAPEREPTGRRRVPWRLAGGAALLVAGAGIAVAAQPWRPAVGDTEPGPPRPVADASPSPSAAPAVAPSPADTDQPASRPRTAPPVCDGQPRPDPPVLLGDLTGQGCSLVVEVAVQEVDGRDMVVLTVPEQGGALAGRYAVADADELVVLGDWDCDGRDTPAVVRGDGTVFHYPGFGDVTAEPQPGRVVGEPHVATDVDGCDRVVGGSA